MDDGSRLPWIIVALLLFCAMFCAVTETAISSASKARIRTAAEKGSSGAKLVLFVLDNFDEAISTLLICTNIVHIATATIVTVVVNRRWGAGAVTISTVITTIAIFFAGEMLPKSIAKKFSEKLAILCAPVLCFFMKVFGPLSRFLSWAGSSVARLVGTDSEISVTEEELYDIIEDMTEEGSLNEEQGDLISSALQFGDVTVESVLTPRVDLTAIDIKSSYEDILTVIKSTTHSRLPVYEGSIDNIIGILQIRKFIKAYLRQGEKLDMRPLLDEVYFVHQSTNIDELLPLMSKRRLNVAIVTDNYGGTLGIVTVEDILEELVGEIWDEDDIVEEAFVAMEDGSYVVDAMESVSDVMEILSYDDPEADEELVNTLMGEWAYEQFTAIPRIGDSFRYHKMIVTVHAMEHNRITRLRVSLADAAAEGGEAQ